uniref:Uncharacterized protein n=1 Tax=Tanacetum cinerariifolium TaxID=118510 RepID=A0A6L2K215_TANCI|nr:hypothetical protein [Tanacetum cinerariifolium]
MAPLLPRDQRHLWLRYEVEGYTEDIVHNFEQILETIFGRLVNRVHVLDFAGLTEGMRQTLAGRLRMVYTEDNEGQKLFTSHTWRRLFEMRGPYDDGRKNGTRLSRGHSIRRLAAHFGLVALGPKRQPNAATGALEATEDAPAVDDDALVDPTLMQAPPPPHASTRTMP